MDPQKNLLTVAPCFIPNSLAGPDFPVILKADEQGRCTAFVAISGQPTVPQSRTGAPVPVVSVAVCGSSRATVSPRPVRLLTPGMHTSK